MIEIITKDPKADWQLVDGVIDRNKLWLATARHCDNVAELMYLCADAITEAGNMHDYTKIIYFDEYHKALETGNIKDTEWYDKHITSEQHHIVEADFLKATFADIIEYIADSLIRACEKTGNVENTTINISPYVLNAAFVNTVEMLKEQIKIKEIEK